MKKRTIFLSMFALAIAGWSFADLDVPSSVFEMDELEEAKEKAAKDGEPLVFVYTNPESTWGPCIAASSAAFKEFRKAGVVVFANSKTDGSLMPEAAQTLSSRTGGSTPRVLVTTADGARGIKGIGYDNLKSDYIRDTVRDLRSELKEMSEDEILGSTEEEVIEEPKKPELFAESQAWTNSAGKEIVAAVQKVEAGQVYFLMEGKAPLAFPFSGLSADSQARLKELAK